MDDFINVTMPPLDSIDVSSWYFTVCYLQDVLKIRIADFESLGLTAEYDRMQLKRLEDIEQYLKMSLDEFSNARSNAIKALMSR